MYDLLWTDNSLLIVFHFHVSPCLLNLVTFNWKTSRANEMKVISSTNKKKKKYMQKVILTCSVLLACGCCGLHVGVVGYMPVGRELTVYAGVVLKMWTIYENNAGCMCACTLTLFACTCVWILKIYTTVNLYSVILHTHTHMHTRATLSISIYTHA